jgi:hypothetical protein
VKGTDTWIASEGNCGMAIVPPYKLSGLIRLRMGKLISKAHHCDGKDLRSVNQGESDTILGSKKEKGTDAPI